MAGPVASFTTPEGEHLAEQERLLAELTTVRTLVVDPSDPACHRTVGAAVEASRPGDRVLVRPGHYRESVIVAKALGIEGDGERETIVVEGPDGAGFWLRADGASLRGLTVEGGREWPRTTSRSSGSRSRRRTAGGTPVWPCLRMPPWRRCSSAVGGPAASGCRTPRPPPSAATTSTRTGAAASGWRTSRSPPSATTTSTRTGSRHRGVGLRIPHRSATTTSTRTGSASWCGLRIPHRQRQRHPRERAWRHLGVGLREPTIVRNDIHENRSSGI